MASRSTGLSVRRVSKKFARSLKRAMAYGLTDIARVALLPGRREAAPEPVAGEGGGDLRPSEFWALRDVSFDVGPGECLGVIGHNGAGKSTLFSILSGIYGPSAGEVEVRGRLQALIALGAGFHPMLTGRENIYINASILGMRKREIDAILEEVVAFAELGEFIDMPVKNYSSGMLVRLGFSVAVHTRPDILLVDEVLAVGDMRFRNKSFARMQQMINSGMPVVFVSHSMPAIELISTRCLWLDHGRMREHGAPDQVIARYLDEMDQLVDSGSQGADAASLHPVRITRAQLLDERARAVTSLPVGSPLTVRLHYICRAAVSDAHFHLHFSRPGAEKTAFASCSMLDDDVCYELARGEGHIDCRVTCPDLAPGPYELRCGVQRCATAVIGQKHYQEIFPALRFALTGSPQDVARPGILQAYVDSMCPVLFRHTWVQPIHAESKQHEQHQGQAS